MRNARIILPLLALAAGASFYYAWRNTPRVERVGDGQVLVESTRQPVADTGEESSRFDFSGKKQRKFRKPRRNLFGPLFVPPPPPKQQVRQQPLELPTSAPVEVKPTPPPVPSPVVSSRMPLFQILGHLEKNAQITAFVSLQGEIYLVKKGELFADEYRVAALNQDKITIVRATGSGEVSLLLNAGKGSTGISTGAMTRPAMRSPMPAIRPGTRPVNRHPLPVVEPGTPPALPVAEPETLPERWLPTPPVHQPIDGENRTEMDTPK
jgi:hypothetical protein